MKALVTGGTGFVGSHIARALVDAGHEVRILHRTSSKLDALQEVDFESVIGDVLEKDSLRAACEGCDWVFHVAAVADYWRADTTHLYQVNVEGTRNVLEAAKDAGVQRVIFTSSAAALGLRADGKPATEAEPFNQSPKFFPYGHSKWLAEAIALEAVQSGQDVVILNPVVIMGPGDLNMISGSFITQVKRFGMFATVTHGGVMVVDVRDVARSHLIAAEKGRTGERYIIGTQNYTYRQWLDMIAQIVGAPRSPFTVPTFMLPFAAAMIDLSRKMGIETPIDATQTRLGGIKLYFDCTKAWKELGPPQIDMRQSLQDTYDWYVENGVLKA